MYFSEKEKLVRFLYNILTHITGFHLILIALFNEKIKLGVKGRSQTFSKLETSIDKQDKVIWFHCASLGEYEQGLPVFQEIKKDHPNHKIVLSFFSPSGYEIRKNIPLTNVVVYLPLDTMSNAKRFLDRIHPELVVFVKYEIWPNYLLEIKSRNIKAILISAIFRKDQSYFSAVGSWMRNSLQAFDHIFVQNQASLELIMKYQIKNVSISGDTRFDRVAYQLNCDNSLEFIEKFKGKSLCIVAGSTWPEDEALLIEFINNSNLDLKFIIAPHNIKKNQIDQLITKLNKNTICFTNLEDKDLSKYQVLILDTIGLLSKTYSYADIAFIGGAVGTTGLHNTLEAAVFGVPIVIGNHYQKFPEAIKMIGEGGMFSISNGMELEQKLNELVVNNDKRKITGAKNYNFIKKNEGAVIQIMNYLRI